MDYCSVWFMGMFGFPAKRPRDPDGSVDLEDDAIRDKKVWGMNGLAASGWSATRCGFRTSSCSLEAISLAATTFRLAYVFDEV